MTKKTKKPSQADKILEVLINQGPSTRNRLAKALGTIPSSLTSNLIKLEQESQITRANWKVTDDTTDRPSLQYYFIGYINKQ